MEIFSLPPSLKECFLLQSWDNRQRQQKLMRKKPTSITSPAELPGTDVRVYKIKLVKMKYNNWFMRRFFGMCFPPTLSACSCQYIRFNLYLLIRLLQKCEIYY